MMASLTYFSISLSSSGVTFLSRLKSNLSLSAVMLDPLCWMFGSTIFQGGVEQVGGGVELGGLDRVVREASLELLVGSHPGVLLVGLEPVLEVLEVDLLALLGG